jgi:hypothetical protein
MINMAFRKIVISTALAVGMGFLAACASAPADAPATTTAPAPAAAPAAAPDAVANAKPEADSATLMEKKFQEAARSYRQVQKDGKTMYCKKEKPMGSTIPKLQCITESQLRLEVEQMEDTRQRMRNNSRCTTGAGCGAGG